MSHYNDFLLKSSIFIVFIFCSLFPNLPVYVYGTPLKIYWVLFVIFLFYMLYNIKDLRVNYVHIYFFLFVLYCSIIIFFNDHELNIYANNLIPSSWYDMNSVNVISFYRNIQVSIFQVLNFMIFFVFFTFFSLYYKSSNDKFFDYILFFSIFIQLIISLYQYIALDYYRAYGSLDNPQALGLFSVLIFCTKIKNIKLNIYCILFSSTIFITLLLSGTKSAIFVFSLMILMRVFKLKKRSIYIYLCVLLNFIMAVVFSSYSDIVNNLILIISDFTNTFSLYLRYILWESFSEVIKSNLFFGMKGTTVHFSENIIWFFLLSYGLIGLILFLNIIRGLINYAIKNSDEIYYLILVCVIQGYSYYGVMIGSTGIIFWSLLGILYGKSKRVTV